MSFLQVFRDERPMYPVASVTEAEIELSECQLAGKQFSLRLAVPGHQPRRVLAIEGQRALIEARTHRKWVSLKVSLH